MIQKPFVEVGKEDIETLATNSVREGRTIEYKQCLPGGKDDEKKEFLADVSSFANASGGDLIFGLEEIRDSDGRTTGIPQSPTGIAGINVDGEIRRLESIVRDGIEPRLPSVQWKSIDGFPNGVVLVARITQSWNAPHMVTFKGSSRFFSRNSAGKYQLDVTEIRSAFLASEALPEKIRRFRDERLAKIIAGETPLPMTEGPKILLHFIPVAAVRDAFQVDVLSVFQNSVDLRPMSSQGWNRKLNLDGVVTYNATGNEPCLSYTLLFRTGIIEAVDGAMLAPWDGYRNNIPSIAYEREVINATQTCLGFLKQHQCEPPVVLMLTLLGVKGFTLAVDFHRFMGMGLNPLDRDMLLLPEIIVDDLTQSAASLLRPCFDLVWQASGLPRCFNYDESGNWAPR